ncbi:hypothetical protein [Actinoplanes sp. NPDC023714]|uniref:hypothetical protein n=1 Tax=Actinoplanes sp. NPDC023714 TaxID=3154322 RepID=UPI0033FEB4FE
MAAGSMAASVVALSLVGAFPAPAQASCKKSGTHAAQSGAQLLRINRLEFPASVSSPSKPAASNGAPEESPHGSASEGSGGQGGWSGAISEQSHLRTGGSTPEPAPAISGVALGDARSVLIANGTIKSAAAARALDGRLSGSPSRNDLVVQQAPPDNRKAAEQRLTAKRFGPLRAGSGSLSAHARWNDNLSCPTEKSAVASAKGAAASAKGAAASAKGAAASAKGAAASGKSAAASGKSAAASAKGAAASGKSAAASAHGSAAGAPGSAAGAAGAPGSAATAEASIAKTELNRISVAGGGNQSLIRVPEKLTGTSTTGLRVRDGEAETIATATLDAGKLALADGEVRIRVLRAATLRVSMSAAGRGEAEYEPAAIEVTHRDGEKTVLDTVGDRKEITLGEESTILESLPGRVTKADPLPLPSIPGLPLLTESPFGESALNGSRSGEGDSSRSGTAKSDAGTTGSDAEGTGEADSEAAGSEAARSGAAGSGAAGSGAAGSGAAGSGGVESGSAGGAKLRISLGAVRQATEGKAIAARATAIRISVVRSGDGRGKSGYSSAVVADLGLGMLEGAAVAPRRGTVAQAGADSPTGGSSPAGGGSPSGVGAGAAGLPITGPGLIPLLLAGSGMVIGGVCALFLGGRRRREV